MVDVLIVDDEPRTVRGLAETIPWRELGVVEVSTASNGREAIEALRLKSAKILLTDIRMPRMDGLELSRAVAAEYPDTRIIFMSAHSDFAYAKAALSVGAVDYILKPIDSGEVIDVIDRVVAMVRGTDEPVGSVTGPDGHAAVPDPPGEGDRPIAGPRPEKAVPTDKRVIRDIKRFVDENLSRPIGLQEVADAVHLSPAYTSAMFRKECGTTLVAYITNQKIDRAAEWIRLRDYYTVSELSERLGFSDYRYFTRVFKRQRGVTPTQFAREMHGQ